MSFRQRLLALLVAFGVLLVAALAWEMRAGLAAQDAYESAAANNQRLRQALRHLQRHYGYDLGVAWTQHVVTGNLEAGRALSSLRHSRETIAREWATLGALAESGGLMTARHQADTAAAHLALILEQGDQPGLMEFFAFELDPAISPLLKEFEALGSRLSDLEASDLAQTRWRLRRQQVVTYGVLVGVCLVLFMFASAGLGTLYRGIEHLTDVARRITARDFTARPERMPEGELGELATAFLTMQEALARYETDLRESELEARAASQAKSAFLAAMSHEIRTPLIGVLGMLEVLGRTPMQPIQRRQFNIVQGSAQSLLEIVGEILDYSKIEAGKVELATETVSVRELVSRVLSTFSATVSSKGLTMTQSVAPDVAAAHVADGMRITQILRNFVGNSVKFTEKGSVAVEVTAVDEAPGRQRLRFAVTDTGIGMTAEQLGRLFRPFAQADAGTARRFGGTGLGLVICHRLAALMGGSVAARSEAGAGTTMTLEVCAPVGDERAIGAAEAELEPPVVTRRLPTRAESQAEGSLLLLAEDHPVNREVLTSQLNLAGFCVDTAEDGARALQKFQAGRYGLVLTDLHMPGLDGFQLAAAIRELERSEGRGHTPVLALTADVVREHVERCYASGMDDYISKPATIRRLVDRLRHWLPGISWDAPIVATSRARPSVAPQAASSARPRADAGVFDRAQFEQMSGGDPGKAHDLLLFYCRTTAEDLRDLEHALPRDAKQVGAVAHRMKGAAQMVGAVEIARIAREVEGLARQVEPPDFSTLVVALRSAVANLQAHASTSGAGVSDGPASG